MIIRFKKFLVKRQGIKFLTMNMISSEMSSTHNGCAAFQTVTGAEEILSILYYVQIKLMSISKFYIFFRSIDKFSLHKYLLSTYIQGVSY
jgi:hypothetical protein